MKVKSPTKKKAVRKAAVDNFTEDLVKIGSSRVLRIPNALIEKAGLSERVTIAMRGKVIVISPAPARNPREDWDERIKREIEKHGPPKPMDPDWEYMPNEFDKKEWTW